MSESELDKLKAALLEKEEQLARVQNESVQALRDLESKLRSELEEFTLETSKKLMDLQGGT